MTEEFHHRLKKWRGKLVQKEAADFLKVPLRTYQAWEYGANKPSDLAMQEIERRMSERKP